MFLSLVLLLFAFRYIDTSENVPISTPLSEIVGSTLKTRLGRTIYAFRGIRYAKPPIGELRFKPPEALEQWSGIYNATVDGPVCPQPTNDPVSEDCLLLNVYTTKLPDCPKQAKRPVIIHLHPGGFYSATGRSNWAGPQYFMDQDIVLVTLNYRIGSLGFISVGREAPGNNGLKDQVMAMKWVKNNIESFGGDASSITLFGYSAGAWSITLHMVSPMSRGLFHKAIISSGSALGHWPLPRNQLNLAKKQARIVGCPDDDARIVMDCLKRQPAQKLGDSFSQFAEFGFDPVLRWSPVIEEDFGQERFLPDHPVKLIESGNFQDVPIVAGMTKDEFDIMAFPVMTNASLLEELNDDFNKYAPICFIYERDTDKSREVSASVHRFYFGEKPITNGSFTSLAHAYSDSIVGFPVDRTVELISKKSTNPVYYYKFTYPGRYSHYYLPNSNGTVPYGVVHHDDLIYLFYISALFPFFDSSFPEAEMVDKLSTLWATFAKTGDPTHHSNTDCDGIRWTPYSTSNRIYLDIGRKFELKENSNKKRYAFWKKLYPLSSN